MNFKNPLLLFSSILLISFFYSLPLQAQETTAGKTVKQKKFEKLLKKKNTVLLDVRTPEEYKEGHIPGSILIDFLKKDGFKENVSTLDKNKTYLLYCRSGKRSNNAKVLMNEMGFSKLIDLKGGFSEWTGEKEIK